MRRVGISFEFGGKFIKDNLGIQRFVFFIFLKQKEGLLFIYT